MTDPRISARRAEVSARRGRRHLVRFGVLFGTVALVVGGVYLAYSPLFAASHIVIEGAYSLPRSLVIETAGLETHPPLLDVDAARSASLLDELPIVGRARVSVSFPDVVHIALTERVAVAEVVLARGGVALLDRTGRVLGLRARPLADLVVVRGISDVPRPGGFLASSDLPLVVAAAAMPVRLAGQVRFLAGSGQGIVATLRDGTVVELGRPTLLQAKFTALATVLAKADLNGIVTIDCTTPSSPVLTPRGAAPIVQDRKSVV